MEDTATATSLEQAWTLQQASWVHISAQLGRRTVNISATKTLSPNVYSLSVIAGGGLASALSPSGPYTPAGLPLAQHGYVEYPNIS